MAHGVLGRQYSSVRLLAIALPLLLTVALVSSISSRSTPHPWTRSDGTDAPRPSSRWTKRRRRRRLESAEALATGAATDLEQSLDFSDQSCGDILTRTSPDDADVRCAYALTCNGGDGLLLASLLFCSAPPSDPAYPYRMCAYLSPLLLLWLIILFRILASTAEDYFAPSPEMLSRRLGLPPRFAGASLLALGNGAPDISATVNAIASDPTNGYNLSLGALTGGGMFVGTVVAGSIIIAADGVPCRGALVRDALAYALGIVLVLVFLRRGRIGGWAVLAFFSLYGLYAATVLAADVYHRRVTIPRARKREELRALERQAKLAKANYFVESTAREGLLSPATNGASDVTSSTKSWGDTSSDSQPDVSTRSVMTDQTNGADRRQRRSSRRDSRSFAERFLESLSNYAKTSTRLEGPLILHGPGGVLADHSSHHHRCDLGSAEHTNGNGHTLLSTMDEDASTEVVGNGGGGYDKVAEGPSKIHHGSIWKDNLWELRAHWEGICHDTFFDEGTHLAEKVLLTFELPFTLARKMSIPVPCEGYYCRPVVAGSVALSPLWVGVYALTKYDVNLFWYGDVPLVGTVSIPSFAVGACIWLFADEKEMTIGAAGPVALYGFVMAATWIDFIGDQLVWLLELLGVILHVPSPVMGLTVLAWGNSVGDLAADVALAKKGLANMAMTACFASPLFNMLIGLGAGFLSLRNESGQIGSTSVTVSPAVSTGFFFLLCNCFMVVLCGRFVQRGRIPVQYAYVMFAIYGCYIVASIAVQLLKLHH